VIINILQGVVAVISELADLLIGLGVLLGFVYGLDVDMSRF